VISQKAVSGPLPLSESTLRPTKAGVRRKEFYFQVPIGRRMGLFASEPAKRACKACKAKIWECTMMQMIYCQLKTMETSHLSEDKKPMDIVMEYFQALRSEIIEAQKLRVQVGLAKIVFLGSLLGFFLKDAKDNAAILICPFVALMFDFMVYGLSFNIRDVGGYIRDHLEKRGMERSFPKSAFPDLRLWQTYRTEREQSGYRDWGRGMFRTGSYGLSILVAAVSILQVLDVRTAKAPVLPVWSLILLTLMLASGWGSLIWLEFHRRPKPSAAARAKRP
jgi:hypothetical protein